MRSITRVFALLLLFVAFLVPTNAATAAPAETERFIAFGSTVNHCNGEEVEYEGHYRYVAQVQNNGGDFYIDTLHAHGIGNQGNEYVISDTGHRRYSEANDHFQMTWRVMAITKGSAPNQAFLFHFDSRDGIPILEVECRG